MMKNETLIRQLDIIPMGILHTPITVIGAGAIGSHVVKGLSQMGFHEITVYDEDVVEPENLSSQGYPLSALGKPKVEALASIVKEYTDIAITAKRAMYERGRFPGVVISAVDNMDTRRAIWENHINGVDTLAVIDPRMGAETAMLFVMNPMRPEDKDTYMRSLYSDADAMREPCTAKATMYCALLLSGLVIKAVKDVLTKAEINPLRVALWNVLANDLEVFQPKKKIEAEAVVA